MKLDDWSLPPVTVQTGKSTGFNGEYHNGAVITLPVKRDPGSTLAVIFLPIMASMLIPMIALWLNRVEDGEFAVDSFELAYIQEQLYTCVTWIVPVLAPLGAGTILSLAAYA